MTLRTPQIGDPDTPLEEGEAWIATWRPHFLLFLQRSVLLAIVTALGLVPLGFFSYWQLLLALPVFVLMFMLIFDDITTWMRHRRDAWFLTERRLIFENSDTPEGNSAVPLEAIKWMRPWMWWGLRIGFHTGTGTALRYIARPRDIMARIEAAQAARMAQLEPGAAERMATGIDPAEVSAGMAGPRAPGDDPGDDSGDDHGDDTGRDTGRDKRHDTGHGT